MSSHPSAIRLLSGDDEALAECVGPFPVPAHVVETLDALAAEAALSDHVPFAVCAAMLASRLSSGTTRTARVIRGEREVLTPLPGTRTVGLSLRAALPVLAEHLRDVEPTADEQNVDVTILVSRDGRRLFVERTTSSADTPLALSWARAFLHLLIGMAADPDLSSDSLALMDETERRRIIHGLNTYRHPPVSHESVTEPFEQQVERSPHAVALVDEEGVTTTYRELNEAANRLAHFLIGRGAGPGTRIGVCLQRSLEQVVAIYAAAKTGGTYVPLDDELPEARLEYVLADADPVHVLTDATCRERIAAGRWQVHDVRGDRAAWAACPATDPVVRSSTQSVVHILYTSGTTGHPKGVAYPANGVLAHLEWMQSRYPFGPGDCAVAKTSPGFDVSVWELFWPLYHGARLVLCRPGAHRDPQHLADLVRTHDVTTIFMPPTVMTPFLGKMARAGAPQLRWALCGGEPVTPRIRDTFYETFSTAILVNCYGPTEAGNVTDEVIAPDLDVPMVPLGRPAANFRLLVLDERLDPVPVGAPGEAYIGGEIGLAHGYWRAPARSAERFVADPYGPDGTRMYRTGDLCRYRDDGVLEHLGRVDRQVKVRGLRIEPGEIESVLVSHESVADAAVIALGDPVRLLAFVVPADRTSLEDLDTAVVADHAARLLPAHMVPEQLVPILRIPVTVNQKTDGAALQQVWESYRRLHRVVVEPADELEAELVAIYARVLESSPISMLDTFTQLGGHSLLAFQLLEECELTLRARPDATELLTGTVRDVAASLRAALALRPSTDSTGVDR